MFDWTSSIKNLLNQYDFLKVQENEENFVISGLYHMRIYYLDEYLEDFFELEIRIDKIRYTLPIVFEKRRIKNFHHKFVDGSLCLAVPMEITLFLKKHKNDLTMFFDNFIIPYLYGYTYFEMYNVMPFGERSHGVDGYVEYFNDIFGINNKKHTETFIQYIINNSKYRGHHICPCGSNKKIRDCHKDIIFHYYNENNEVVLNEIKKYIGKLNYAKKSHTSKS